MAKKRTILILIVCFSITLFTVRTTSRARGSDQTSIPPTGPDPKSLRGLTDEQADEVVKRWFADRRLQQRKTSHERLRLMMREAWKRELRLSERQWRIIEPKYEREQLVSGTTLAGAACGLKDGKHFYWRKATEDRGGGWPLPKTEEELTEGERIVCELIDLMRRKNASDEELREKIDALQQVREKARKELPRARREMAAVLTTPRQEAVFLLMGRID